MTAVRQLREPDFIQQRLGCIQVSTGHDIRRRGSSRGSCERTKAYSPFFCDRAQMTASDSGDSVIERHFTCAYVSLSTTDSSLAHAGCGQNALANRLDPSATATLRSHSSDNCSQCDQVALLAICPSWCCQESRSAKRHILSYSPLCRELSCPRQTGHDPDWF